MIVQLLLSQCELTLQPVHLNWEISLQGKVSMDRPEKCKETPLLSDAASIRFKTSHDHHSTGVVWAVQTNHSIIWTEPAWDAFQLYVLLSRDDIISTAKKRFL